MVEKRTYYIGSPNGVILCVDRRLNGETIGRIYHAYSKEANIQSHAMEEMNHLLEGFFDRLRFPFPGRMTRHSVYRKKRQNEKKG